MEVERARVGAPDVAQALRDVEAAGEAARPDQTTQIHQRDHRLHGAPKRASFKVSCGRRFGELNGALLWTRPIDGFIPKSSHAVKPGCTF